MWLTLFWLDVGKHGFNRSTMRTICDCPTLWVQTKDGLALWRNRLALALFEQLPADLADDAIDDFVKLVDTDGLYPETVAIFASAAPAVQSRIVEHLKTAKAVSRQTFAKRLYDRGLDVNIPEVERPARPWR